MSSPDGWPPRAPGVPPRCSSGGLSSGDAAAAAGPFSRHRARVSSLYKTELCRSWAESGACAWGSRCVFAHGAAEVRPKPARPPRPAESAPLERGAPAPADSLFLTVTPPPKTPGKRLPVFREIAPDDD